ncbi:MAG TPA: glycoside hydrolase family 57 protein [Bacteroidales bacterium]|nr:glycoside hydrolase family 57 protein [Bacteroidales bacterium]
MKTICLYFQVHQPFRFRRYRFFEMGKEHYYYDDYSNESIMRKVAMKSYLPANKILLEIFKEYGCRFKVAFSISGTALDQMELYAPDVLESFQKLAASNCVEFLSETYSHTLASLINREEFENQVKEHQERILKLFGKKPVVFRNTELIYNNEIGEWIADMGYKAAIIEGAKHILGWKSPNYVYCSAVNPRLKLLLKNYMLSDDLTFRFSDVHWNQYPLTAEKFTSWIKHMDQKEDTLNLFMNYDTFGNIQPKESGIFEFLKAFPKEVLSTNTLSFSTPSDLIEKFQPISALSVPHAISWADEERDTSAWLGNELQKEAFYKLFNLRDMVLQTNDPKILTDWKYFQTSDHFYYMCTKFFVKGSMHSYFNPFSSPYDAFINYMNILSDFEIKIKLALSSNNSGIKKTNGNGTKKTNNIAAKTDKEKVKKVVKKTTAKTAKPTKEDVVVEKTNKKTAKKETTKEKVKKSKKA